MALCLGGLPFTNQPYELTADIPTKMRPRSIIVTGTWYLTRPRRRRLLSTRTTTSTDWTEHASTSSDGEQERKGLFHSFSLGLLSTNSVVMSLYHDFLRCSTDTILPEQSVHVLGFLIQLREDGSPTSLLLCHCLVSNCTPIVSAN